MTAKFEIGRSSDSQFYFHLKAGNGEIILQSQQYTAKASAQAGIDSVKVNAPHGARYERKTSTAHQPYFTLKGANSETLGRSQMYSSESGMEKGIAAVMKEGPSAPVDDLT